ncbi:peptidoglycan editing factor PgeF [Halothiobacillus sp.]|uniref:peptidoglycan editing factor PgeF n=1 Tax=Halothiobacillus sp. TaxID=1891311 RepID=UPI002AD32ED5|nr:peptidoglycan editing factor PgeF [Halothiobacillus sp.]
MSETRTDPVLIRADWPAPPGVHAVVTTRLGGISASPFDQLNLATHVGDDPAAVTANRARLKTQAGLPSEPRWLNQVHGVIVADGVGPERLPDADAGYTDQAQVVLSVLTADCLSVVFCSRDGRELAVAHAGWRGLAAGVLAATIARFNAAPAEMMAWIGPAIGPQAFEVGGEVRSAFVDAYAEDAAGFSPSIHPGKYQANLFILAQMSMQRAGIRHIFGGGLCTFSDPQRFYSFRRDAGRTGRMATLAWRSGDTICSG